MIHAHNYSLSVVVLASALVAKLVSVSRTSCQSGSTVHSRTASCCTPDSPSWHLLRRSTICPVKAARPSNAAGQVCGLKRSMAKNVCNNTKMDGSGLRRSLASDYSRNAHQYIGRLAAPRHSQRRSWLFVRADHLAQAELHLLYFVSRSVAGYKKRLFAVAAQLHLLPASCSSSLTAYWCCVLCPRCPWPVHLCKQSGTSWLCWQARL